MKENEVIDKQDAILYVDVFCFRCHRRMALTNAKVIDGRYYCPHCIKAMMSQAEIEEAQDVLTKCFTLWEKARMVRPVCSKERVILNPRQISLVRKYWKEMNHYWPNSVSFVMVKEREECPGERIFGMSIILSDIAENTPTIV